MDKIVIKNQLNPTKRMRLERGLKQMDMERLTGIPQACLSRLERNVREPTDGEIKAINAALFKYEVI